MHKLLMLTLSVGSLVCLANPTMAAKAHVQKISKDSAEAFCKNHGGGTSCDFKDGDHLHLIHCDSKGKCFNTVNPARKVPSGGTLTNVSGTKTSSGGTKVSGKNLGSATAAGNTNPQTKGPTQERWHGGGGSGRR